MEAQAARRRGANHWQNRRAVLALVAAVLVAVACSRFAPVPRGWPAPPERILAVDSREEGRSLLSLSPDGVNRRELVRTDGLVFDAVASPDGRRIAYCRASAGTGWQVELVVLRLRGMRERVVARGRRDALLAGAQWSPDGRRLAFEQAAIKWCGGELGSGDGVFIVGVDGQGLRRLGAGLQPRWSPDSRQIAFVELHPRAAGHHGDDDRDSSAVAQIINADGSGRRALRAGLIVERWSADGRRLLCSRATRGVAILAADTGQIELELPCKTGASGVWSPDGRRVAVVEAVESRIAKGVRSRLVVWTPEGARPTRGPSVDIDGAVSGLQWLPRSNRVVLMSGGVSPFLTAVLPVLWSISPDDGRATVLSKGTATCCGLLLTHGVCELFRSGEQLVLYSKLGGIGR